MRALRLHESGSLKGIRWDEVPMPVVKDYDVLVKIKATSLNYRHFAFITGRYPLVKPLPVVLASDAAGVVEEVGSKVTRFKHGDKVISLLRQRWHEGKFDAYKAAVQLAGSVDGVFSEYYAFHELSLVKAGRRFLSKKQPRFLRQG